MSFPIKRLFVLILIAGMYMPAVIIAQTVNDTVKKNTTYVLDSAAKINFPLKDTLKKIVRTSVDTTKKPTVPFIRQDCSLIIYSLKNPSVLKRMEYKKAFKSKAERNN